MNTAEHTVSAIRRSLSIQDRIGLVMPWVSESSRAELQRISDDVGSLLISNRRLSAALGEAQAEIERLRGARAAA